MNITFEEQPGGALRHAETGVRVYRSPRGGWVVEARPRLRGWRLHRRDALDFARQMVRDVLEQKAADERRAYAEDVARSVETDEGLHTLLNMASALGDGALAVAATSELQRRLLVLEEAIILARRAGVDLLPLADLVQKFHAGLCGSEVIHRRLCRLYAAHKLAKR